jgi:uncharacterized protein (DUF305 family)
MNKLIKLAAAVGTCAALAVPSAFAQAQAGHDMKSMMQKNMDKMMSMQPTGEPDVDFAMMMREHHKGGIDMAQWQLEHGKDPKMKAMARKIMASQKKEIAEFDQWLASKGHKGESSGSSKHSK